MNADLRNPPNYCDGCEQPVNDSAFCVICEQEYEDYQREKAD